MIPFNKNEIIYLVHIWLININQDLEKTTPINRQKVDYLKHTLREFGDEPHHHLQRTRKLIIINGYDLVVQTLDFFIWRLRASTMWLMVWGECTCLNMEAISIQWLSNSGYLCEELKLKPKRRICLKNISSMGPYDSALTVLKWDLIWLDLTFWIIIRRKWDILYL